MPSDRAGIDIDQRISVRLYFDGRNDDLGISLSLKRRNAALQKLRRKCIRSPHDAACRLCIKKNASCSLARRAPSTDGPVSAPQANSVVSCASSSEATPGIELPPREVCRELLELYFDLVDGNSHSIFHRPTTAEDLAKGTFPHILLFAIIGLVARFSKNDYFKGTDRRTRGAPYAHEGEKLLNLRDVSLTTIQACVLLGSCATIEGNPAAEIVYYSVAHRICLLLGLPDVAGASQLEYEVCNRVWWTLYMVDTWLSNAFCHPRLILSTKHHPLPMEELKFMQLARDSVPRVLDSTERSPEKSLLAQMVKLNTILAEIGAFNREAANRKTSSPAESVIPNLPDRLGKQLDDWYDNLPSTLVDTSDNFFRYGALGLGDVFVAVYLGYYHYGALLFYQYLHDDCFEDPAAKWYATKCREFSAGLCETVYRAYSTPGCGVYYSMVGHVLVIASTVQLQILIFSTNELEIKSAKIRLERNFRILTELQSFWPSLDVCLGRLREFHNACQQLRESSFRMDSWMLQFLFDFGKPVDSKLEAYPDDFHYFSETLDLLDDFPPDNTWHQNSLLFT